MAKKQHYVITCSTKIEEYIQGRISGIISILTDDRDKYGSFVVGETRMFELYVTPKVYAQVCATLKKYYPSLCKFKNV